MTTFQIPPDTRSLGSGNPPQDINSLADVAGLFAAVLAQLSGKTGNGTIPAGNTANLTAVQALLGSFTGPGLVPSGDTSGAADMAAIQSLLNLGATVQLQAGMFYLNGALAPPATGCALAGYGMNATVVNQVSTSASGIASTGARYVTISGLTLKGPSSGSGIGIYFNYTSGPAVAHVDIRDVRVLDFGGAGVNLQTPIVCTLTNIRSETNGGNGFTIANGTSVKIDACYATGNTGNGYELDTMTYAGMSGCAADSNGGMAYLISGSGNLGLLGCGAEANTGNPFQITGCNNVSLISCYCSGNAGVGCYITGSSTETLLMGFRENSPAVGATASIKTDAGSSAVVITPSIVTATSYAANTVTQVTPATVWSVGVGGTSAVQADRGSTTNFANLLLNTAGSNFWSLGLRNDSTNDLHVRDTNHGLEAIYVQERATQLNIGLLGQPASSNFGSGVGVVFIANDNTDPSGTPVGGGLLYVSAGALKYKGSSGTVTTIANA